MTDASAPKITGNHEIICETAGNSKIILRGLKGGHAYHIGIYDGLGTLYINRVFFTLPKFRRKSYAIEPIYTRLGTDNRWLQPRIDCHIDGEFFFFFWCRVSRVFLHNRNGKVEQKIFRECSTGAGEQYHSELKSDFYFERLASSRFVTNALLFLLAMLAFNVLRFFGQSAFKMKDTLSRKLKVQRRRLRSVIKDLIYIACKRAQQHLESIFLNYGDIVYGSMFFDNYMARFC
ncbi:MAG: hypothetical protein WC071_11820 [Victivallaceae bacterium]